MLITNFAAIYKIQKQIYQLSFQYVLEKVLTNLDYIL